MELFQTGEISTSLAEDCQLLNARGERCFLLISPWKSASFVRIGSVIGIVNQSFFQELLNENTSEIVHGTFILDSNRNIIAQEANELLLSEEEVRALAALYPEGIQATDDYNLLFAQSEINGWLYMTVIPHSAMRTTALTANRFLLISIVMITGILLQSVFGLLSKPINRFATSMNECPEKTPMQRTVNSKRSISI